MRIAVNTRLLLPDKLEGIGWFTYEVLKRITDKYKEHQFIFIFDRPYAEEFVFNTNVVPIVKGPSARHPLLFYYWFEKKIPSILKQQKADLFFSPDGYLSLNSDIKSLPVIHDLNFVHRPTDLPFLVRNYYNHFFPKFAAKANRIATVSKFSKTDIQNAFGIQPNKIDVVYNGVKDIYKPMQEKSKKDIRDKWTNGNEYFLYVGSLHKRKNIANIILAFDRFKQTECNNYKFVIVGEKLFGDDGLKSLITSIKSKKDIIFTGRLPEIDLAEVMASAFALLFVPFFEGFGVPVIEALASGTPVITSSTTSLPEVAENAALFANPDDVDGIVEKMRQLVKNNSVRNDLINNGLKRAGDFSWDKTAKLVWQSIERTLSE